MRKEFQMTPDELKGIMEACRPVPMIMLQCGTPSSPQENANRAWQSLAAKYGFDWESVRPVSGKDNHYFTAESAAELVESPVTSANSESAKCQHTNFERRQVLDFSYNHCLDCGYEWKC